MYSGKAEQANHHLLRCTLNRVFNRSYEVFVRSSASPYLPRRTKLRWLPT